MPSISEIVQSSRNRIVLAIDGPKFISVRFSSIYSKTNAMNLAILSSACYFDEKSNRNLLFKYNQKESREIPFKRPKNVPTLVLTETSYDLPMIKEAFRLKDFPQTDTQLFHFETKDYLLIAFRGTEISKWRDLAMDLEAAKAPFPYGAGFVHRGFLKAFESARAYLDELVSGSAGKPIILTGHSLGGALATVAAAYFRTKYKAELMVYTYGSPLVGDMDFCRHYTEVEPFTYFRVVNNQDLVTMVPPPKLNLRTCLVPLGKIELAFLVPATADAYGRPFSHLGKVVFIRRIGASAVSVDVDRKQPYYLKVPADLVGDEDRPKMEKLQEWSKVRVSDHLIDNYISILGSDFKIAVETYLDSAGFARENSKKILDYLDAEIKSLEKAKAQCEREDLLAIDAPPADATGTASTSGRMTRGERWAKTKEALDVMYCELSLRRDHLVKLSAPGVAEGIFKEIIEEPLTPSLKREFEYQRSSIKF